MALHFYALRKSIKDGTVQPINSRFGERAEMERQFHLYCASAATNGDGYELDSIEYGTIEQGAIERKTWVHETETETPVEAE